MGNLTVLPMFQKALLLVSLFLQLSLEVATAENTREPDSPLNKVNPSSTYTNPVGGDIRMGDPFVLFSGGTYYLYGTNYKEGFQAYRSSDLVDWQAIGTIWQDSPNSARSRYWAPEVHAYQNRFYLVFSCRFKGPEGPPRFRLGLAAADSPSGPFETVKLPWFENLGSNIDAHLFLEDERPYLFFNKVGYTNGVIWGKIYAAVLSPSLKTMVGEPVFVGEAEQPWEHPGSKNETNEGAFVFKHNQRYYLTYSSNHYADPNYGIGYATASNPLGPWTKSTRNPVLSRNLGQGVSGPGHSCMVRSPDSKELFIVYHAHAEPERPSGNRTVNIDRVHFDEAGALVIQGPTRSPQPLPSGVIANQTGIHPNQ